MNAAEHYAEAERLLEKANEKSWDHPNADYRFTFAQRQCLLAEAQVHATLALAAATADQEHTHETLAGGVKTGPAVESAGPA